MSKKVTKIDQVRTHLLINGSISQLQAWHLFSYSRLSDAIWKLRHKESWDIISEDKTIVDRNGNTCQYALYRLISTPETSALKQNIDEHLANKPTGNKTEVRYTKKEKTAAQYASNIIEQAKLFD